MTGKRFVGEKNPRHQIVILVGTGNQYCRNCEHLVAAMPDANEGYCAVFKIDRAPIVLKYNDRFGLERCPQCRNAEKELSRMIWGDRV